MKKLPIVLGVVGLLLVLAFGVCIWPTAYSYREVKRGHSIITVRINRLSGDAERLDMSKGWVELKPNRFDKYGPAR